MSSERGLVNGCRLAGYATGNRKRMRFPSPRPVSDSEDEVVIEESLSETDSLSSDSSAPGTPSPPTSPHNVDASPVYRRAHDFYYGRYGSPRYFGIMHSDNSLRSPSYSPAPSDRRSSDCDVIDDESSSSSSRKRSHRSKHNKWSMNDSKELSKHFAQLYESKDLSDVTLVVENIQFPAHKLILAARSSYFRGMFYGGLRESVDKEVVLHEVSAENFGIILRYMYTGSIVLNEPNTSQLVTLTRLAHMYDLEVLQKSLVKKLENIRISLNNFYEMFTTSVLLSLDLIKGNCRSYTFSKLSTICKSNQLCDLSVVQLEELFMPRDWSKSKDKIIANGLIRYIEKNPSAEEKVIAMMKKVKLRFVKEGKEWVVCRDIYHVPSEKRRRIENNLQ